MNNIEIIDLTHTLSEEISVFPGGQIPVIQSITSLSNDRYREKKMILSTHHGTHIDCPYHMIPDGFSAATDRLASFYGKGTVIDCRAFLYSGFISAEYLKTYNDKIAETDFLLINTGMDKLWNKNEYIESFPVLSAESVEYLCQFSLKGIGIDTLSIDSLNSKDFNNHIMFLARDIVIIENLTGLEKLLCKDFFFACFPLKIKNGDGSPVRACALVNQ